MFKDGQFYPNIILLTKDINFGKIMEESLQLGWSLNEQQMCLVWKWVEQFNGLLIASSLPNYLFCKEERFGLTYFFWEFFALNLEYTT
jgi:hypothetical protein